MDKTLTQLVAATLAMPLLTWAAPPLPSSNGTVTVYYDGVVHTMASATRDVVAQAFAVDQDSGTFLDVGTTAELRSKYPDAGFVDLHGQPVLPGLTDGHAHLLNYGMGLQQVDLVGTNSVEEVIERLLAFVEENPVGEGEWLLGRGWDQTRWPTNEFPTKHDLDPYFPDTPVWLKRVDGHACWANSATLDEAGDLPEEDPEGGEIIRDETGDPTGIFIDNAMWLIDDYQPPPTDDQINLGIQLAIEECHRYGLTGVHDAGVRHREIEMFKQAVDDGRFNLRNYVFLACDNGVYFCPEVSDIIIDYGNRLTVRSVKVFLDGALGSWGAAMIEPYTDNPESRGLLRMEPADLPPTVDAWVDAGYQVNTHAIGDHANQLVIDAYENTIKRVGLEQDLRLRVEHAQIVTLEDIERFGPLKIIASMQPTHATSDMGYAEDRIGPERIKGAYAWRKFLDSNTVLCLGSDFPVELMNPFEGIYSAVTRQDHNGLPEEGWYPEERLSVLEAIYGFTMGAAYSAFQEKQLGSIEFGKWADFIIIDKDPFVVEPLQILNTTVLKTYFEGKQVLCLDCARS